MGPGRWKLNTYILNDRAYRENITKSLVETAKTEYKSLPDQLLWEICKTKIKEYSISYCTRKIAVKKNILNEIEQKIELKE